MLFRSVTAPCVTDLCMSHYQMSFMNRTGGCADLFNVYDAGALICPMPIIYNSASWTVVNSADPPSDIGGDGAVHRRLVPRPVDD